LELRGLLFHWALLSWARGAVSLLFSRAGWVFGVVIRAGVALFYRRLSRRGRIFSFHAVIIEGGIEVIRFRRRGVRGDSEFAERHRGTVTDRAGVEDGL
jgi:hypothetical protein